MSGHGRLLLLCGWLLLIAVGVYLITGNASAALLAEIGGMVAGLLAVRLADTP